MHHLYYNHTKTDCFVLSQLFCAAKYVKHLKLGSKPAKIYVRLRIILLSLLANYVCSGIMRH